MSDQQRGRLPDGLAGAADRGEDTRVTEADEYERISWPECVTACVLLICITFGVLRFFGKI